jgi:hypothetical protein
LKPSEGPLAPRGFLESRGATLEARAGMTWPLGGIARPGASRPQAPIDALLARGFYRYLRASAEGLTAPSRAFGQKRARKLPSFLSRRPESSFHATQAGQGFKELRDAALFEFYVQTARGLRSLLLRIDALNLSSREANPRQGGKIGCSISGPRRRVRSSLPRMRAGRPERIALGFP